MKRNHAVKLALELAVAALAVLFFLALYLYVHRCRAPKQAAKGRQKSCSPRKTTVKEVEEDDDDDLLTFQGGESLTACDIMEAPGEVIGKSKCSTLYKAELPRIDSVKLLRFMRPVCSAPYEEVAPAIELLGSVRHPNLLPLLGFYGGRRGEKLLVYPFHFFGNLSDYLHDADKNDSLTWPVIRRISIDVAKGLDHLHTGLQYPIIHGNLKSKNILLDRNNQPYISDIGLHLLLKPESGQQMLETLASQGYKAPEVTEIRNVTVESDIYSLGVIFLELVTGKDPVNERGAPGEESCLPSYTRKAVVDGRISGLYSRNLVLTNEVYDEEKENGSVSVLTEEMIMHFLELALACCSPSPSLRPDTRQLLRKLQQLNL